MFSLVIYSLAAVIAAGVVLKIVLERFERTGQFRITWLEFAVEIVLMAFVVAPATSYIGMHMARTNLLTFNEFWNGWEVKAVRYDTTCHQDGRCYWTYDCDPYPVPYPCGKDGSDICIAIHYHACPYVTVETNYVVETTLGGYTIAQRRFPDNPNQHRWRAGHHIPDYIVQRAGAGIPDFWLQAKQRLEAGNPGPVTKRMSYLNYIYASDMTNLKQYSPDVKRYLDKKLLPPPANAVHDFYLADKVHFVGYVPKDAQAWQQSLARMTAALGTELNGDLQLVIVQQSDIGANPDSYAIALRAYWQDTKVFGTDAFSKNGIGLVVGTTDGKTVAWARAFTGMPLGNEALTVAVRNELKGTPLAPDDLIGTVRGQLSANGTGPVVQSFRTGGALASLLWGQPNPATKFARVSMTANNPTGHGSGFLYLASEIRPTTGQTIAIVVVVFFLGLLAWWGCAIFDGDELLRELFNATFNRRKTATRK